METNSKKDKWKFISLIKMPILIALIVLGVYSAYSITGNRNGDDHPEKYCARVKDGKVKVVYQGKELNKETKLNDGTKIKTDGTIIKKDGTQMELKNGECIDKDGKVMNPDMDNKPIDENKNDKTPKEEPY